MSKQRIEADFLALNVAVLTVSDTRTEDTDTSGAALADRLTEAGHTLISKKIVKDDIYQLRSEVSQWIASSDVQVVLITGGTGFTTRDNTPQAIRPLLDKEVDGFGELFRHISLTEIGTSTIQSRALAGLSNGTVIFCIPGSTGACLTAWDNIISEQIDIRHRPCNFVGLLKTVAEAGTSQAAHIDKCTHRP